MTGRKKGLRAALLAGASAVALLGAGARAATVTVNGADEAIAANPNATPAITFSTDHTATIADNINITGNVVAAGGGISGRGTLSFAGNTAVESTIGTSTDYVKQINVAAGVGVLYGTTYIGGASIGNGGRIILATEAGETINITNGITTSTNNTGWVQLLSPGAGVIAYTNIGTSSFKLAIVYNSATANTLIGNIYATEVGLNHGTLQISGNIVGSVKDESGDNSTGELTFISSTTTGGDIGFTSGGANAKIAAVNFNGAGTSTLNHNIRATTTTIASGATLAVGTTDKTVTGTLVSTGSLDLSSLKLNHSGILTLTSGGGLKTTITSSANGWLSSDQNNVTPAGTLTVTPTVSGTSIGSGDQFILIRGAGTANVTAANVTVSGGGGLLTWAVDDGSTFTGTDKYGTAIAATDVVLKATAISASSVSGVSAAAGRSIDAATSYTGSNAKMISLQSALLALSSGSDIDSAGTRLRPDVGGGSVLGSFNTIQQILNLLRNRVDASRLAHGDGTGIATGDAPRGLELWAQGFAGTADQQRRDAIDGYGADTAGLAFGGDAQVHDAARLGLALSYARTDVSEKGSRDGNTTGINSYGAMLYGHYEGAPWYLDASLGYTRHRYDSSRKVDFTGFTGTASGDFAGNQYTAKVGGGYPVEVATGSVVTPLAQLAYNRLDQQGYTETGSSGANLTVDANSTDSLRSGLGAKVSHAIDTSEGRFVPEFRAVWLHEFMDTEAPTTTAAYAAGGSAFTTTGAKPTADALNLGVGLTFLSKGDLSLSGHYDAELKSDYTSHTGKVEVRMSY